MTHSSSFVHYSSWIEWQLQTRKQGSRAICQAEMGREKKKSWGKKEKTLGKRIFSVCQSWRISLFFPQVNAMPLVFFTGSRKLSRRVYSVITWKNWKKKDDEVSWKKKTLKSPNFPSFKKSSSRARKLSLKWFFPFSTLNVHIQLYCTSFLFKCIWIDVTFCRLICCHYKFLRFTFTLL